MLEIGVVTLFPAMIDAVADYGVTGRALRNGLFRIRTWNPRDYACDKHRTVDDRPYGGGPGMVMMVEPLRDAIRAARSGFGAGAQVVALTPQGRRLDQAGVAELLNRQPVIFVAGRYEGIDERLLATEVDAEWSIGDYVLSGGELAALVIIDAMVRLLPGCLGHDESARTDSFMKGLLDHPQYTRPEEIAGLRVPDVLLSGDHEAIRRWRHKEALGRTWLRRPDLLASRTVSQDEQQLLDEFLGEQGLRKDSTA